uniref:Ig-like domain-containing protein n=1 Tax=Monopterus albus TaxID=43700 RepID=A0A3Q3QFB5_MONAL
MGKYGFDTHTFAKSQLFITLLCGLVYVPHQISLTLARLGDNITLMCPVSEKEGKFFHWYKQSLGYMVQRVATEILSSITVSEPFKNSRFTVTKEHNQHVLSIRNISKEDEATYLCQNGTAYSQTFIKGTFLAVNVIQIIRIMNCFCGSLLSKSQENRVQCPGEHNVHWFRAGSGYSHPSVLYTQRNSSDGQEERSCVYSLSKTIQDSSDTGTYYCAVATCGQILFGEGTKVEANPLVLVLGVLLACCVVVIAALIFFTCRRRVCEQCQGRRIIYFSEVL